MNDGEGAYYDWYQNLMDEVQFGRGNERLPIPYKVPDVGPQFDPAPVPILQGPQGLQFDPRYSSSDYRLLAAGGGMQPQFSPSQLYAYLLQRGLIGG
jgi:hypothetical protein